MKMVFLLKPSLLLATLLCFPLLSFANLSGGALDGERPRLIVLTDTSRLGEPSAGGPFEVDDHQSIVRLLLYSDVVDVEGIIHSVIIGNRGLVETIEDIIDAYELDYPKLKSWSSRYPSPEYLRSVTVQGATWGPREPSRRFSNSGSQLIIEKANNGDPRPLWILAYGTITDVAQALFDDPTIKSKIRVIGSYQNFTQNHVLQPNDDPKAIAWIQQHHSDLYFIESLETLKSTAFSYSGFTYHDSNQFMEENCFGHGVLGQHMWTYRKQDRHGNPESYSGWLRLGDDPTLNYLLRGDLNDPTRSHWGGRFKPSTDPIRPNYFKDLQPVLQAHLEGQKYHRQWLEHFAQRLDRSRDRNHLVNSDFEERMVGWTFSPGATVAWGTGPSGNARTKLGKITLNSIVPTFMEQNVPVSGGASYTISGWIRTQAVSNTTVELWGSWETPSGRSTEKIGGSLSGGNGAWARVWENLTAPGNATGLTISFKAGAGSGVVYLDEWGMTENTQLPPKGPGHQLLFNGDFSHGLDNWAAQGAQTVWIPNHQGSSTRAGKLNISPTRISSLAQKIPVQDEHIYTITGWILPQSLLETTVKIWAYWNTKDGTLANSVSSRITGNNDKWMYVWQQFTSPPQATGLTISIEASPGTGKVYIEDLEVWEP